MELKPGYKQTEVGVIPEDWGVQSLQDLCKEEITYGIVQCGPHVPGGVPYIRVSDMDGSRLDKDKMLCTTPQIASRFRRSEVRHGDIVYALRGRLGDVRLVPLDLDGANLTQGTARISPGLRIHGQFLLWALRNPEVVLRACSESKGTTFMEITLSDLRQIKIAKPPETEQLRISSTLSDIEDLLMALRLELAKKRNIKQATMQELLTGKRRLPGFEGEWEVKRLDEIADVIDPHPSHRAPDETSGGIPFLGIGDLDERGNVIGRKLRLVDRAVLNEHAHRYSFDDELIGLGRVASIGKVVYLKQLPGGCAISPTLGIIRGRIANRKYLMFALRSSFVTEQFTQIMSGSTRSSIGMEVLRKLNIKLPPTVLEQDAIAEILNEMDVELATLEAHLDKTLALKQGMMQQLLTGKIRLR